MLGTTTYEFNVFLTCEGFSGFSRLDCRYIDSVMLYEALRRCEAEDEYVVHVYVKLLK